MTHGIKHYKLIVYVPTTHADIVRDAMGNAGAGIISNYSHCSFSVRGTGRYKPTEGATPFHGAIGNLEMIEEERIEITVHDTAIKQVISAMKSVHPYDEIAYDVYELTSGF